MNTSNTRGPWGRKFTQWLALALIAPFLAANAHAALVRVAIDTAALGTGSALLDLQFAAPAGAPSALAQVSNTTGFTGADLVDSWGLDQTTPGVLGFSNATPNDALFAVSLGGQLSFDLELSGDIDPSQLLISRFAVSLLRNDYTPLGAADPYTGALLLLDWVPASTTAATASYAVNYRSSEITLSTVTAAVPEPSTLALCAAVGLALLVPGARRRTHAPSR